MMYKTAAKIHSWLGLAFGIIIFVTCLSGAVLELLLHSGAAGSFIFKLHRWLMDAPASRGGMSVGKIIVGISTIMMVILVITGIILWIPRAKANLPSSLKIRFSKGGNAFIRSSHVAGGMYVSLFVLVMAVTGLTWSFGWWHDAVYGLLGNLESKEVRRLVYGLHTGTIGGIATQVIWTFAALIASTLPITGYCIWFRKKHKHS